MGLDVVPQPDTRQGVCGLAQVLATVMGLTALPSRTGRSSRSNIRSLSWVRGLYWGCGTWRATHRTCWVASRLFRLCLPRATRRILAQDPREERCSRSDPETPPHAPAPLPPPGAGHLLGIHPGPSAPSSSREPRSGLWLGG